MAFSDNVLTLTGDYDASNVDLEHVDITIDSGSVIIDSSDWYHVMRSVRITRIGSSGPALIVRDTRATRSTRWSMFQVIIAGSTGTGVEFQGTFLGDVHGLYVRQCESDGVVLKPYTGQYANKTGSNAVNFFGGEVQSCERGIYAENTKGVNFYGFTPEGNRGVGLHLNQVDTMSFHGGVFENNGTQLDRRTASDIYIEKGSRVITIEGNDFSDGRIQHRDAIDTDGSNSVVCVDKNMFRAYSEDIPVKGDEIITSNNLTESTVNPVLVF